MPDALPPDLMTRLNDLLVPLMGTPDERDFYLTQAFYISDRRLYHSLDLTGAPRIFTIRCIRTLLDKCLPAGNHALSALLDTVRPDCGAQDQRQIAELSGLLNDTCNQPSISVPEGSIAPVPSATLPAGTVQTVATLNGQRTPTVFLSYSRADADLVQRLMADLQAAGHSCWIDTTDIKGGELWVRAIAEGITNSYAFVAATSRRSLSSQWCRDEILWARKRNKPIFPILIDDCTDDDWFFLLNSFNPVQVYQDYAAGLRKLLAALPTPTIVTVTDSRPDTPPMTAPEPPRPVNQRALELEYLERLSLENWITTIHRSEEYTPMKGKAQVNRARDVSALMPTKYRHTRHLFRDESDTAPGERVQEQRDYTDIITAIRDIRRAALLGEPGAGKTTTLWKLAKELFATAQADPKAPLPILIRLGKWTAPDQSLRDFIAAELGDLGTFFEKLLATKRAALLLDGLNEIPIAQRKAGKDEQVRILFEQAQHANPALIGVVSCRERDYTIDLGFDRVVITPLDPLRVREFVTRYLGNAQGEALFWRLAGGDEVYQVWQRWQQAGVTLTLFLTAADVPMENLDVFSDRTWADVWLWEDNVKGTGSLLALAGNPYMLMMMTDLYRENGTLPDNRGELFTQFVDELIEREAKTNERMVAREAEMLKGLAALAYLMQTRRDADNAGSAATALPLAEVKANVLDDELLYLAASASLLSVSEVVRFTHQLMQEYFAATSMLKEIRAGRLKAADLWPRDQWGAPTGWEEATILLAGMFSADCTPILEWVAEANPEVAAQCIMRSGAHTPQPILQKYRADWIAHLTDLVHHPDPRSRAAVGRALAIADLDNRPGVGLRPDGLPDIAWCEVPAGEFIYQYGEKLTLPTFSIAKYPITYKQFQVFIDAPNGYVNAIWWKDLYPTSLGEQHWKIANHPRENVTFDDAVVYCRWLSAKLGYEVRLPTEEEFEKAARGMDGRAYPWGNEYLSGYANIDETEGKVGPYYLQQTSAVGIYPQGVSPYGIFDLSGNVWEWVLTESESGNSNDITNDGKRVLRGGSWDFRDARAHTAARYRQYPNSRNNFTGFRVVLDPISPSILDPED